MHAPEIIRFVFKTMCGSSHRKHSFVALIISKRETLDGVYRTVMTKQNAQKKCAIGENDTASGLNDPRFTLLDAKARRRRRMAATTGFFSQSTRLKISPFARLAFGKGGAVTTLTSSHA